MIDLAIAVLWLVIGIIILLGVVWLALYALKMFGLVIPPNIEKGVYLIVLIICIIAALSLLGGGGFRGPAWFR